MRKFNYKYAFTLAEALLVLMIMGVIATFLIRSLQMYDPTEKKMHTMATKIQGNFEQTFIEMLLHDAVGDDFTRIKFAENDYFSISDTGVVSKFATINKRYLVGVKDNIATTSSTYFSAKIKYFNRSDSDKILKDTYSNFFYTNDGVLIGYKLYGNCTTTETLATNPSTRETSSITNICGSIFYDVNGETKPNKLGSDQYILPIDKRGIKYIN